MKRKSYLFLTIAVLMSTVSYHLDFFSSPNEVPRVKQDILFIENLGQWDGPYHYKASFDAIDIYAESDRLTYALIDPSTWPKHDHGHDHQHEHAHDHDHQSEQAVKGHAMQVVFQGANEDVNIIGLEKESFYHNYFLGADSSAWKSHVPIYKALRYQNLYDGVDMELYKKDDQLKYDFVVKPGISADKIEIQYKGLDHIELKKGELILHTSIGRVIEKAPIAYQQIDGKRLDVPVEFSLKDNVVKFRFPAGYDEKYTLTIDPVLIFSTYSGSISDNFGTTAAFDKNGNGYLGSLAFGGQYPVTLGTFDLTYNSIENVEFPRPDVVLSKFTSNGSNLIYSTYLGGIDSDVPHSIIVTDNNELIVLGTTGSDNFPTTSNAFDRTFGGGGFLPITQGITYSEGSDIFVSKFSANGSQLIGSTFLGGEGNDGLNIASELVYFYADDFRGEVNINDNGEIFIASGTSSRDFPVTANAYNTSHNGGITDAVLVKLTPNLSQIIWATYFGGEGNDFAYSMKLDANNSMYFSGGTSSNDLPTTSGAVRGSFNGGDSDGFIGLLSQNGNTLQACTYLGTDFDDQSYFIELDPDGDIFAMGTSRGGTYPVTPGRYVNANSAQFIHKLKPLLDSTYFSTTLGNRSRDGIMSLNALMIDDCRRIYFSGWYGFVNNGVPVFGFPITSDAYQTSTDGSDFYFCVLEPDARDIEYATYFGGDENLGEHVDGGTSRFDRRGIIYQAICAGCDGVSDLPVTATAFSTLNRSINCNAALVKFDFQLDEINVRASVTPDLIGCAPFIVDFVNQSRGPIDIFEWDFGDGSVSEETAPSHIYDVGTYTVSLIGRSAYDCVDPDTATIVIEVFEPTDTENSVVTKCIEDPVTLISSDIIPGATYEWNTRATTTSISVSEPGIYWVKSVSSQGCFVDTFTVENLPIPSSLKEIEGCEPNDYILRPLELNDAFEYEWSDGSTNPSLTVESAGIFWVKTLNPFDCDRVDSFTVLEYPLLRTIYHDISLCLGKKVQLIPTDLAPDNRYEWSTGATSQTITVDEPGIYVSETFYPNPDACTRLDTFIIERDTFNAVTLDSIRICEGQTITISSQTQAPGGTYRWISGQTTPSIEVSQTGLYEVTADYENICPYTNQYQVNAYPVIDENDIYVPNAFSPNGDGINDVFRPFFSDLVIINSYRMQVFNRWGGKVFESIDPDRGWRGNNMRQQDGEAVFVWLLEINLVSCSGDPLDVKMKGDISIIR